MWLVLLSVQPDQEEIQKKISTHIDSINLKKKKILKEVELRKHLNLIKVDSLMLFMMLSKLLMIENVIKATIQMLFMIKIED